jgi:RND family efflux transporter MFP subunit
MKRLHLLALATILVTCIGGTNLAQAEDAVTMPVVLKQINSTLSAPARVQPVSNISLTAPTAGLVSGLHLGPGATVRRGEVVARLTGPMVTAERTRVNSELKSAEARLSAATQTASIEQQKFDEHLSTRDNVSRVQADLATARQQLAAARAAATSFDAISSITAPDQGIVTTVSASNGQFVPAGQALVSVAPLSGLHVVATLYGDDASVMSVGMAGSFEPDGAGKSINVKVEQLSWNPAVAGQLEVWLVQTNGEELMPGAIGTVTFGSTQDKHPAVPTSSLILDGGQWWVLVHDGGGNHRRHVAPGPAEGGWTVIRGGLNIGERVVTQDAYLLFHEDFARRYQQAD